MEICEMVPGDEISEVGRAVCQFLLSDKDVIGCVMNTSDDNDSNKQWHVILS